VKDVLFVIPARGGSKGIPGKNIKPLGGKPLILYSVDFARKFVTDDCICVSTDSPEIKAVAETCGVEVPFLRPPALATDTAGSYEVMLHALDWYATNKATYFKTIILLQPTSPFRLRAHLDTAYDLFLSQPCDMVVSVEKIKSNVSATYYKEKPGQALEPLFSGVSSDERRQAGDAVYKLNGSIYIINTDSLKASRLSDFKTVRKYEMDELFSADIDEPLDWLWCEFLLREKIVEI
jgi:CMP-N,N'-diacetyllegionaminic acid synthase